VRREENRHTQKGLKKAQRQWPDAQARRAGAHRDHTHTGVTHSVVLGYLSVDILSSDRAGGGQVVLVELYSYIEKRETPVRVRTAFHAKVNIRCATHGGGHGPHAPWSWYVVRGSRVRVEVRTRAHAVCRTGPRPGEPTDSPDAKPKAPLWRLGLWATVHTDITDGTARARALTTVWHTHAHTRGTVCMSML
jgi:hypothetical protein